ncbi:Microtubule cross-linking factor 1 [Anabarilius grahami]|uniref:Microtubule cross-linking factor 1 n=1 Tax=Anabarilius grahami TaxID=495550 RepID=A0A3N0Y2V9_ANAGA|nr:Microtubule cross-linking factor 1 [Anabarilius grahami]
MWNAFGNGSSGYVSKAQGWEFVPCSRLERPGKKVQSPARVRSFPSNLLEQLPPGPAAASDATREQTPSQELQSPHTRLKKKFEDLKKRFDHEKEEWRMEKEMLLRQVADIQGGENRRILLDLKCVLEEVQSGVKREESKRGELELQYIQDRCAWELERSELKRRITQLEVRGCSVLVETVRSEEPGDTLKRERVEQKRLLADTHSAAMDLRCRLESSERGWVKEKSELLERFETERKEWENQLMDMQRKIEELYNEVKAHRTGSSLRPNTDGQNALRLSSCSASTLSSEVTYPSDAQSNEYSEAPTQQSNASIDSQTSQLSHITSESSDQCKSEQSTLLNQQGTGEQQAIDTAELEEILESCLKLKMGNKTCFTGQDVLLNPFKRFQSMEITCGSDKKKNSTALNAALKEIARVSEELCSYQDEMRKWPDIKRSRSESMFFPRDAELVERVKDNLEMEDTVLYLKNMSEDLKSLDEQYWMNWESCNMESQQSDAKPPDNIRQQAPPIPTRSTSWYLSSHSASELESSGTEHLCQQLGTHPDRKYTSPAIVRKFEAMLQENEGKILTDSGNVVCSVPVDSKCNISCCQSRWSCDGSRFGSNKSSRYVPVKRCLSNIDIAAAATDRSLNQTEAESKNDLKSASHPMNMPTDSVASIDFISPYPSDTATSRNERLEQKTAEFNRTLFQAGMGLRCGEDTSMNVSTDCSTSLPEVVSKDTFTESPSMYVEDNLKVVLSDLVPQCPKEEGRRKETKDLVSKSSSPQQECILQEDMEVKPFQTEHTTPTSVDQIGPSVREKGFEIIVSPPQLEIQTERCRKVVDVSADQHQAVKKSKQAKKDMCSSTRSRILDENPWKPSTLAAYPRPMESRSNYGAVERILKSYEDLERSREQKQSQPSPGKEEDLIDLLEMLDKRHEPTSSQRLTHTPHHQVIAHKETHVTVQQGKESSVTIKKSFSRPVCPAKRRLPSRWASRSSVSSASSPSPPPTVFTQRQTLTYSTYHTETVI